MLETPLFEQVADAVRSMTKETSSELHLRWHRRGLKAWFGPAKPTRSHYEAQIIPRRHVDGRDGMAIEIGFHAEHKDAAENERVLAGLLQHERT